MGRPSPVAVPIAEHLIREPTRPFSAIVELPGELALAAYTIPTVAIPHYATHPHEIPGIPLTVAKGMGEEFISDPAGSPRRWG